MAKRVGLWLRGVPRSLKEAMIAEAREQNTSVNDVAARVLAEHFRFPYEQKGIRRTSPRPDAVNVIVNIPPELRQQIKQAALQAQTGARDLAVQILSEHFDTEFEKAPSVAGMRVQETKRKRFSFR